MKIRIWLTVAFFIFLPALLNAQIVRSFGFKFGGAKTNQTWKYSNFPNFNFGSRFGLDIAFFFDSFDLQFASALVEVHYIQKGISEEIPVILKKTLTALERF